VHLQTKIPLQPAANPIDYDSQIMLVGSCFVEHIGAKFEYYKFRNSVNPFGILFHPEAIARFFEQVVERREFKESDFEEVNGSSVSFDAHSKLSATSAKAAAEQLNTALADAYDQLEKATHIFITLGTAWGYRHKVQDKIVANCHKIPQREFEKELALVAEVEAALQRTLTAIAKLNSNASVTFTVSPVRHIKDGFVENQRSKAHLIAATHALVERSDRAFYFPAYEIVMDELRDYRFYDRDLIHPNALAVDYIWEAFESVYLSPQAQALKKQVEEIQRGLEHRPFNPNSDQHQQFLKKLQQKIARLQREIPHIQF